MLPDPDVIAKAKASTSTKKIGQAEDVAEVCLYLMKDSSADWAPIRSGSGKFLHA